MEDPKDANQDNIYKVVDVIATDDQKLTGKDDVDDYRDAGGRGRRGELLLHPACDRRPDHGFRERPRRQHHRRELAVGQSPDLAGTYLDIDGATTDTYTPRAVIEDNPDTLDVNEGRTTDEGMFLQATVMYRDKASPDGGRGRSEDPAMT